MCCHDSLNIVYIRHGNVSVQQQYGQLDAHLMSENKTNILHIVMGPRTMITVIVNTLISVTVVVDLKPAAQPMMYRTRLNHNF